MGLYRFRVCRAGRWCGWLGSGHRLSSRRKLWSSRGRRRYRWRERYVTCGLWLLPITKEAAPRNKGYGYNQTADDRPIPHRRSSPCKTKRRRHCPRPPRTGLTLLQPIRISKPAPALIKDRSPPKTQRNCLARDTQSCLHRFNSRATINGVVSGRRRGVSCWKTRLMSLESSVTFFLSSSWCLSASLSLWSSESCPAYSIRWTGR